MIERVTRVSMTAFRGVPEEMTIELPDGRSLVGFGDNGTGKSTIADALEWYFTGRIELLRHEGRQQALRNLAASPQTLTSVVVETTGELGGTIDQTNDSPPPSVLRAAARETFLLRGRTLVAFVEKPKAEKWKALAQILGLDGVDRLRLDLQRARNDLRNELAVAEQDLHAQAATLSEHVDPTSEDEVHAAISRRCIEAGVEPPASFESALDPGWARSVLGAQDGDATVEVASLASEVHSIPNLVHNSRQSSIGMRRFPKTVARIV